MNETIRWKSNLWGKPSPGEQQVAASMKEQGEEGVSTESTRVFEGLDLTYIRKEYAIA